MRYTLSQDGKERATVIVRLRLTREELALLRARAKRSNVPVPKLLESISSLALESEIDAEKAEA